jgi:AcrR family transcriptional regulator
MSRQEQEADTRCRVLHEACRLFAARGYRETTVHDICEAAHANVAAVNYYFGSKENLYREVWRHASECAHEVFSRPVPDDATPEDEICEHIRMRIECIFDPGTAGWFPQIIKREMTDPTPLREQLSREFMQPLRNQLETAVRSWLGPQASDAQIAQCTLSIISHFILLNAGAHIHQYLFNSNRPDRKQIEAIIRHVQTFCTAGIGAVNEQIEKEQ